MVLERGQPMLQPVCRYQIFAIQRTHLQTPKNSLALTREASLTSQFVATLGCQLSSPVGPVACVRFEFALQLSLTARILLSVVLLAPLAAFDHPMSVVSPKSSRNGVFRAFQPEFRVALKAPVSGYDTDCVPFSTLPVLDEDAWHLLALQ
jgi:hypothetical protein